MAIIVPNAGEIAKSAAQFRGSLLSNSLEIVVGNTLSQKSHACVDAATREAVVASIRTYFGRDGLDCLLVGSANQGFSIVEKRGKPRYRPFSSDSDVDIAIVSSTLFDQIWEEVFLKFIAERPWHHAQDFQKYFFRGWIRPDKLPYDFKFRSDWFDFFRRVSKDHFDSLHSVSCGLYKSRTFLTEYHRLAVAKCRDAEEVK
jgi:hypothetical protein